MNKQTSPRMQDDIDRVDLSKLSVTELHSILTALHNTINQSGTSQTFSDYFMPLWEDVQDAFYENSAQTAKECLMKVTTLTEDHLAENYSCGLDVLKETYQFIGAQS